MYIKGSVDNSVVIVEGGDGRSGGRRGYGEINGSGKK